LIISRNANTSARNSRTVASSCAICTHKSAMSG
jgi:hypothetical protein